MHGDWEIPDDGELFRREWFVLVESHQLPRSGMRAVRYWDLAATEPSAANRDPDWTVGLRLEWHEETGDHYITDIVRERRGPGAIEALVKETAQRDGPDVAIHIGPRELVLGGCVTRSSRRSPMGSESRRLGCRPDTWGCVCRCQATSSQTSLVQLQVFGDGSLAGPGVKKLADGHSVRMDSENEVTDEKAGTSLAIPQSVQRAAGDVVHRAFERLLSSDVHVTTAAEGKRLLSQDDDTEQMTDAIQRFVGIATPVVRIALRGARFTRIPWVLVASSSVSIGVTVRTGVRELQVLAALLAHRFEEETGGQPDAALLQKLTLDLYLRPRRAPNVSDVSLPLARLARRWIVSGALGRNTRGKTDKALDAAERLDMAAFASRSPVAPPGRS